MKEYLKKIIIIDSNKKGPIISIIGGNHGNEPCGMEVITYLSNDLTLKKGKVFLIPGNLKAIEKEVRQIDVNLNRIFQDDTNLLKNEKKSYEYKRSREIIPFLKKSDFLLDIHSTSIKKSDTFAICEPKSLHLAKLLNVPICCLGFDSIEPGSTVYYMNKHNKKGIGVECGYHKDKKTFDIGINAVRILLSYFNMIDHSVKFTKNKKQKIFQVNKLYKTKTNNFKIAKKFNNFEMIRKDQLIARDGKENIISNKNQYIIFAHNRTKIGEEGFITLNKK